MFFEHQPAAKGAWDALLPAQINSGSRAWVSPVTHRG